MSNFRLATISSRNDVWQDQRMYTDQDYRNKMLEKNTAQHTISKSQVLAADQVFSAVKSLTDSFIAYYREGHNLIHDNVLYKIDFNMPSLYVQTFVPLAVNGVKQEYMPGVNLSDESIARSRAIFDLVRKEPISDERCAELTRNPKRLDMCKLFYRMYTIEEDSFSFIPVQNPLTPPPKSVLFGAIGSPEPISTSDPNYTFLFVFLRDFVLKEEYQVTREPNQIISSNFVATSSNDTSQEGELGAHDIDEFLANFQVIGESATKPLDPTVNKGGEISYSEPRKTILEIYGARFKEHIKNGLAGVYHQMRELSHVKQEDYANICKSSYIGMPLPFLHKIICEDIIRLSRYMIDESLVQNEQTQFAQVEIFNLSSEAKTYFASYDSRASDTANDELSSGDIQSGGTTTLQEVY